MELEFEEYDFEEWEDDKILFEKEDWVGLLKLRHKRAEKQPSDLYAQQRYAEALILNKKYKEALDLVSPLYQENHESGFGISEILDALFGLGKTEKDFSWISKPSILRLDQNTLDLCIEYLKGKRKYVSVTNIYVKLIMHADYSTFNEKQLAEFLLKNSQTFDFTGNKEYYWDIELKLKKKK